MKDFTKPDRNLTPQFKGLAAVAVGSFSIIAKMIMTIFGQTIPILCCKTISGLFE
jgi:hypothetical protein